MTPEVQAALDRMMQGQSSPEDEQVLRQALLGLPPASPEFKMIASAMQSGGDQPFTADHPASLPPAPSFAQAGYDPTLPGVSASDTPWKEPTFNFGNPLDNGRGVPSLDFLAPLGEAKDWLRQGASPGFAQTGYDSNLPGVSGDDRPPPAAINDLQGTSPPGSNTKIPQTAGWQQALAAARNAMADTPAGQGELPAVDTHGSIPQGYSFSDMNVAGVQGLLDDPARFSNSYAREHGGDQFAGLYEDPIRAAMAMASAGVIGPGGQQYGNNLQGAIGQPVGQRLQAVEDFMNQYTTKGTDVRPELVYQQMFDRTANTDFHKIMNPQTQKPLTAAESIDYTNATLMTAAPFMTNEGQAQLSSILAYYKNEYLNYLGTTDETSAMSYPAYLQSQGVDQLLSTGQ